jgi:hypothetical protein
MPTSQAACSAEAKLVAGGLADFFVGACSSSEVVMARAARISLSAKRVIGILRRWPSW